MTTSEDTKLCDRDDLRQKGDSVTKHVPEHQEPASARP